MDCDLELEHFCVLIPENDAHPPIPLPHLQPTIIGRSPLTLIKDKRCSRNQVELTANYEKQEVSLKQLGAVPSKVVGHILNKNETYVLGPGGSFKLLDLYTYHVHFGQRLPERVQQALESDGGDRMQLKGEVKEETHTEDKSNQVTLLDVENDLQSHTKRVSEHSLSLDASNRKRRLSPSVADDCPDQPAKQAKLDSHSSSTGSVKHTKPVQRDMKSFFGETSSRPIAETLSGEWKECGTLLVFRYGLPIQTSNIIGFDLDLTLIETVSGKKFPTGPTDWKFMKNVISKLRSIDLDSYRIVIVTNQVGIPRGKPTKREFQQKVEAISAQLRVPLLLLASLARDVYRKPCTGMWTHMIREENGGLEADIDHSIFVGDAAGREANWKPGVKKDFSCADRKFAANLCLPFLSPEEYFLQSRKCTKFTWGEFDPRTLDYSSTEPQLLPSSAVLASDHQEVILFVGYPGSGKSTFYASYLKGKGYAHVNRDTLGSWQKCVAECTRFLKLGKSLVVDNTSPDKESRSRYIKCAQDLHVPVRCFWFVANVEHAKHNNRYRELTQDASSYKKVTDMVFNIYRSRFSEPEVSEGFEEVIKVSFSPTFIDNKHAQLYKQFLL